ncbi:unnamed protein product [Schistosoma mattheei]|uniref:Uncharacterized protein n=1 Tax=Schistosoma mattheei TaxID=31246 RepID=A0A183PWV9_9TREM|nr:unnamed protein product [Schistosoma mattheei]
MGSAASHQTRDVTFHPDDIVISEDVIKRIKNAATTEDNTKDDVRALESSKPQYSLGLKHELEEAERRYEKLLQLLEKRVRFCFLLSNAIHCVFLFILS